MHQILKPLLVTLALAGATTSLSISADTIRLTGPNGEVISTPQYSQPVRQLANQESGAPARYYGPTAQNETLWSIASRFKPSGASVQQTIYAFYELNPGQFEKGNIHQLSPGSELRIPSSALINRVDLQEALAVLAAHQAKLNQPASVVASPRAPVQPKPEPQKLQVKPEAVTTPTAAKPEPVKPVEATPKAESEVITKAPDVPKAPDVTEALREELSRSESELLSLEERNHQLRLMLSEVQHEVEELKTEVDNEERIRTEVERQLSEEKRKQAEMARLAPSQLDVWLSKPWFVALLAFVPALLLGLLVMAILRSRKRRNDEPTAQLNEAQTESSDKPAMAAAAGAGAGVATAAVASDDDDELFSDDLLAGLDDEAEESDVSQENDENDVFADLDEADFDFNLDDEDDPFASIDDDGELDIGVVDLDTSNNGISVKDGEKALGLEEMERALNDVAVPSDDEELDFNLSDEDGDDSNNVVSQDDLDSLFADFSLDTQGDTEQESNAQVDAEELLEEDSALNQAQMDELLAGDDFDLDEGDIDLDDLSADSPLASLEQIIAEESDADDEPQSSDNLSESVDNDDIDDLFAQFSQIDATPDAVPEPQGELDNGDVDLLDDMLTGDFELSDLDDSDLTLDEVLSEESASVDEDEDVQLLADEETELDENSTELLDEVLFESSLSDAKDDTVEDDFDLDPFGSDDLLGSDISDEEMDALFAANVPEPMSHQDPSSEQLPQDSLSDDVELAAELDDEGTTESLSLEDEQLGANELDLTEASVAEAELHQGDEPMVDAADVDPPRADLSADERTEEAFDANTESDVFDEEVESTLAQQISHQADDSLAQESIASESTSTDHESFEQLETSETDDAFEVSSQDSNVGSIADDSAEPEAVESPELTPQVASDMDFDFAPEIESGSNLSHHEDDSEQSRKELDALVANEFGLPQDDDWVEEEPQQDPLANTAQEDDADFLANALQSEYGEEQAFADAEGDSDDEPVPEDSSDAELAFSDDELPEYSEDDAFADANLSKEEVLPEPASEPLDSFIEQEPQSDAASELETDSFSEPVAELDADSLVENAAESDDHELGDVASDEVADLQVPEQAEAEQQVAENPVSEPSLASKQDAFDDFEFPEFTEQDALLDMDESEPLTAESPDVQQADNHDFEDDFSLESLPEYDEQQAAVDLEPEDQPLASAPEMVGETLDHSEIDALADAFSMVDMSAIEQEGNLDELLQDSEGATFSNISPVDQTTADSAGLDIDAMLQETAGSEAGEDWNGFTLTDEQRAAINHDIPDEEQAIWSGNDVGALAKASDEDWSSQDPVADFDAQEKQFMTIDELMAQVDDGETSEQEEEELKLDVGLDEFPDVIGPISEVDVDSDSEAAGNLDMAKIYIEMNDFEGAVKLLEKVLLEGSGQVEQEAKRLLSKLSEHQ
ncbi:FimV/HubP family polar landmark protein [Vibrio chaetopteri]|uniref:FimV/HubP family polar landmark protein n=1 Tax=Vibrio chaetopteri TaxID=3016528 RepID=UPI003AB29F35